MHIDTHVNDETRRYVLGTTLGAPRLPISLVSKRGIASPILPMAQTFESTDTLHHLITSHTHPANASSRVRVFLVPAYAQRTPELRPPAPFPLSTSHSDRSECLRWGGCFIIRPSWRLQGIVGRGMNDLCPDVKAVGAEAIMRKSWEGVKFAKASWGGRTIPFESAG